MILAFIEKYAAYISALKDGALRRNLVKRSDVHAVCIRSVKRRTMKSAAIELPRGNIRLRRGLLTSASTFRVSLIFYSGGSPFPTGAGLQMRVTLRRVSR